MKELFQAGRGRYIAGVTLGYAIFALSWIFLSDQLLLIFADVHNLVWFSTAKGVAFVLITAMGLFFSLRYVPTRQQRGFSLETLVAGNEVPGRLRTGVGFLFAAAITLAVIWMRWMVPDALNERPLMIIYMLPVILSAAAGGIGPGLLATGLVAGFVVYRGAWPALPDASPSLYEALQLAFLLLNGLLVSVLCEVLHRALRRIESVLHIQALTLASAGDGIITTDIHGNVTLLNAAAEQLTGWTRLQAKGEPLSQVLSMRDSEVQLAVDEMQRNVLEHAATVRMDEDIALCKRHSGETFVNMTAAPIRLGDGGLLGMILTCRDVTERRQSEAALRQAATVFESSQEGVIIADAQMRMISVNRAFSQLTGYGESELSGRQPSFFSCDCNRPEHYEAMWQTLRTQGSWQGELWDRRKNGEIFPALISINAVKDKAGEVTHYVGVLMDIASLKDSEARLDFLAHHDPLTQLPNRLLLFAQLEQSLAKIRRDGGQLGLLMFDLDRFKDVNDSYGHLVGDELLKQVAVRLMTRLRGTDSFARLGGDEFTVLLEGLARPEDAARVAEDIIDALSEPFFLAEQIEIRTGASIGISFSSGDGVTAETLLQQADSAMYRAKAEGRGRFRYFSESLTIAARERIEVDSRLRRALRQGEFRVYYQPQVDVATGRITGAEALIRWHDPQQGVIPPLRFIPIAEETGMIRQIGEWVLRETCRQGRAWIDAGLPPLSLAVNVSPRQLQYGNLLETVDGILQETGFPSRLLELELSESTLMEQKEEMARLLNDLRAREIRLAIDDFGTGYSSLAYLKRFPLDVLKIDKSFVDDIAVGQDGRKIIKAIIEMGHALGIKVLAEGVESVEQLEFLQAQGSDLYQGYLRSQPLPAAALEKILEEQNRQP